jgi:hypothetical protein
MNFPWIAIVNQTALFVILSGRADYAIATVTHPLFAIEIQIEVLSDA